MRHCHQCSAELGEKDLFCAKCGAKQLEQMFCTQCGHPLPQGAAFCSVCGTKVSSASAGAQNTHSEPTQDKPHTVPFNDGIALGGKNAKPVQKAAQHNASPSQKSMAHSVPFNDGIALGEKKAEQKLTQAQQYSQNEAATQPPAQQAGFIPKKAVSPSSPIREPNDKSTKKADPMRSVASDQAQQSTKIEHPLREAPAPLADSLKLGKADSARAKVKKKWLLPVTAVLVLVAFLFLLIRGDIQQIVQTVKSVNDPLQSVEEPAFQPDESYLSGTEALKLTPIEGLTISADENALDTERKIEIESLNEAELLALENEYEHPFQVVISAFHIDAGLGAEEQLPGELNFEMDLKKMGVDKAFWDNMEIVRIDESGQMQHLNVEADGDTLTFSSKKNSIIVALGCLIIPPALTYLFNKDRLSKFNGYDSYNIFDRTAINKIEYLSDEYHGFRFLWPSAMPAAQPTAVEDTLKQMESILSEYGWNAQTQQWELDELESEYVSELDNRLRKQQAMMQAKKDARYRRLEKQLTDKDWVRENLWPTKVKLTSDALDHAVEYFNTRNFSKIYYTMDIMVLDPWPKGFGDHLAEEADTATTFPFIRVNAEAIELSGATAVRMHELNVTLLHEYFHAIQENYGFYSSEERLWLTEAAAVLLESEAMPYYIKKKWADASTKTTGRSEWGEFQKRMLEVPNAPGAGPYGYTASQFLEYLRDHAYKGNKDDFLVSLMRRFFVPTYAPQDILAGATVGSTEKLGDAFIQFIKLKTPEMNAYINSGKGDLCDPRLKLMVEPGRENIFKIPINTSPNQSFFASMGNVTYSGYSDKEIKESMLVVDCKNVSPMTDKKIYFRWNDDKGDTGWQTMSETHGTGTTIVMAPMAKNKVFFQLVAGYTTNTPSENAELMVFLLEKPEKPTVNIVEDEMEIILPTSPLARQNLIKGYEISIKVNGKGKPVTVLSEENRVVINLKDNPLLQSEKLFDQSLIETLSPEQQLGAKALLSGQFGSMKDMLDWMNFFSGRPTSNDEAVYTYEITYHELTDTVVMINGPESEPANAEYTDEAEEAFSGDIYGKWEGHILFTPEDGGYDITEPEPEFAAMGYDIKARIYAGGSDVFYGKVQDNGKGYQLFYLEKVGDDYLKIPAYRFTKFGKNKIISYIPPAIFKRVE